MTAALTIIAIGYFFFSGISTLAGIFLAIMSTVAFFRWIDNNPEAADTIGCLVCVSGAFMYMTAPFWIVGIVVMIGKSLGF